LSNLLGKKVEEQSKKLVTRKKKAQPKQKITPIKDQTARWLSLTTEQLKIELNDLKKYPESKILKQAASSILKPNEKRFRKREKIINTIIERISEERAIANIGRWLVIFLDGGKKISEKEIQILYQTHPYLIEREFLNKKIIPQYTLRSGFADIVVFLEEEIVVVELKVDPLEISHLLQLNGYLEDFKHEFKKIKKIRGILIGKEPKENLNGSIEALSFEVKIIILKKEISTEIKLCENCRLANDIDNLKCFNCSNSSFFKWLYVNFFIISY